jgi:hypothetical protein
MRWALLGLGLVGCAGSSDVDDTDPFAAPDVAGRYNVILEGTNGCMDDQGSSRSELIESWASGPMTITGSGGSLDFDFEEDVVLGGGVSDDYGFSFAGTSTYEAYALDISGLGVVYSEDDRWVLEGDFEVLVSDGVSANDCTITGPFKAFQVG